MNEALVQWTLLNNPLELSKVLNFDILKIVAQEISTDHGRIDFVLSNSQQEHLIVELETNLNTTDKLNYCFKQILNYKNVKFTERTNYCILFSDDTNEKNKKKIYQFGNENQIKINTYSLQNAQSLYIQTINRLTLNVGLAFPNPKNYTICYLRWLNKIMRTFSNKNTLKLSYNEIFAPFKNPKNSKTNFNCHEKIALDFELFYIEKKNYILTNYGKIFVENIDPHINLNYNISSISLTNEQKRLLIKVLTNGKWENNVHKVNIYWFLRFMEVTNGSWLPKNYYLEQSKLDIANSLFKVSYKARTMCEFLTWCCNYCVELGFVEKIKLNVDYDQVYLTPLGVEINNIFSLDLTLKKYRMNLNFKYLD